MLDLDHCHPLQRLKRRGRERYTHTHTSRERERDGTVASYKPSASHFSGDDAVVLANRI
ncbi:hypothetical protein Hdeb2414_s0003g00109181 [Helianthus debilis subsp. tardiflorus]